MVPDARGNELEHAVRVIEGAILQASPALYDKAFKIEMRKRTKVGGVHHEIDIYVTVEVANGYTAIFIFECKNWKDAVGKNEIIIFAEKVDAVSAQGGFFVAKSHTKDAEAQALKDQRIKLLTATEHDPVTTFTPDGFHYTAPAGVKTDVVFRLAGSSGKNKIPIDVHRTHFSLGGTELPLGDYLKAWTEELYKGDLLGFPTAHLPEGVYPMLSSAERCFGKGECVIDGKELEHVRIHAEFGVKIIRPPVISHYEVATRGRVIRLARIEIANVTFETSFVTVLKA